MAAAAEIGCRPGRGALRLATTVSYTEPSAALSRHSAATAALGNHGDHLSSTQDFYENPQDSLRCASQQQHVCICTRYSLAAAAFFRAQVQDFWYSDVTCLEGKQHKFLSTSNILLPRSASQPTFCGGAARAQQGFQLAGLQACKVLTSGLLPPPAPLERTCQEWNMPTPRPLAQCSAAAGRSPALSTMAPADGALPCFHEVACSCDAEGLMTCDLAQMARY